MSTPTYRIKDWARHYEVSDSKKVDGPLSWVAVRTKQDGFGFRRMASERNNCELFASFVLMVQIAARQPKVHRGRLVRDGRPLTARGLALMTGFAEPVFERALKFFSDPEQGWLEQEAQPDMPASPAVSVSSDVTPGVTASPASASSSVRTCPDASGASGSTGQDITGQDHDRSIDNAKKPEPTPPPIEPTDEEIYAVYPRKEAKAAALKAIAKAASQASRALLYAATKTYAATTAQWPQDERHFIPHPATWFNRGSYFDDPAMWVRQSSSRLPGLLPAEIRKIKPIPAQ